MCRTRTAFRDLNPQYGEFFEVGNLPAAAGQPQEKRQEQLAGAQRTQKQGQGQKEQQPQAREPSCVWRCGTKTC